MEDDFLSRCADSDPETAALLVAVYNEGVRDSVRQTCSEIAAFEVSETPHWYTWEDTGGCVNDQNL